MNSSFFCSNFFVWYISPLVASKFVFVHSKNLIKELVRPQSTNHKYFLSIDHSLMNRIFFHVFVPFTGEEEFSSSNIIVI
jgi:hypothetical protein